MDCRNDSQPDEVPSTSATLNTASTTTDIKAEDEQNHNATSLSRTSEEGGRSENEEEDEFYRPPEPDYSRANALKFYSLTRRFEAVWKQKQRSASSNRNIKKASKEELLEHLFPTTLMTYLKGGSPFPFLRLMVPDKDTIRPHSGMKEKMIASVWGDAIGLNKNSPDYLKLTNYNDPIYAGPTACGDLSLAVFEVIEKRHPSSSSSHSSKNSGSKITVGQINNLLDELAKMKLKLQANTAASSSYITKRQMRSRWVEKLIAKNLSALEHKWIVRILLQRLDLGIGSESMLNYYHPWAADIYSANKNIRTICAMLCDAEFVRRKKEQLKREVDAVENHNRAYHLPKSNEPATLNSTIAPMLSMRTSFESLLSDIQKRHHAYTDSLDKDDPLRQSLALKFPSFVSEIKLDGERILAHCKRGVVKMQTRNSVWYSDLYSPVLGPPLRRAIAKYDIDVILDGEVIAWDNERKEIIPFGSNRTVANYRREWCRQHGQIDSLDIGVHNDESEGLNVISTADSAIFEKPLSLHDETRGAEAGRDCWLKFVVFDILYIGGPDAQKAVEESCRFFSCVQTQTITGSIINCPLSVRKFVLYKILKPQENMIEIVETNVIRSDGTCIDGMDYFAPNRSLEFGMHPAVLDSITCTLDGKILNLEEIDFKRRKRQTDTEIERKRARCLESFHAEIVLRRCLEGLIFKDLATPYGLGSRFRNKGYWFKLKDDYNQSGNAADIDVVVLGGSFATGMRKARLLNRFLCGCRVDNSDEFMTLCTINGGGTSTENLEKVLRGTGFNVGNTIGEDEVGSWFKGDGKKLPDFISQSSYQRSMNSDNNGWKYKKDHYCDLWIEPKDSFVLTINAGEIVSSVDHSAGVSLRFPRISRIRTKDFGDPKSPHDVETISEIHNRYFQKQSQQQTAERELSSLPASQQKSIEHNSKFLTSEQHSSKLSTAKKRKSRRNDLVRAPNVSSISKVESKILSKYIFTVLEGTYNLDSYNLDGQQARNEGWFLDANMVNCQQDIIDFILRHGGRCQLIYNDETNFIVGGTISDARVANHRRAIEAATVDSLNEKTKHKKHLRNIADMGVIRWTFLFRIIHRIFIESKNKESLKETAIILKPRRYDFLVLSQIAEKTFLNTENFEETTLMDLKLALDNGEESETKVKRVNKIFTDETLTKSRRLLHPHLSWQYRGINYLEKDEQWVLEGPRQHFWCSNTVVDRTDRTMVLYPDLFRINEFGYKNEDDVIRNFCEEDMSKRWHTIPPELATTEVASVVPLAQAMGAQVTPHLYNSVTHILCELKGNSILKWGYHVSISVFTDIVRGTALQSRLIDFEQPQNITLVSPTWIRLHWNKHLRNSLE